MNHGVILGMFGGQEIFIIALVILVLFGGKKIPELMRGVGKGLKEFKNETKEDDAEKKEDEKK
ncbi:Sec-independent protein translocase subunit TatA/TatB [Halosquirtibacter xylanolyticus]|uniref:Sec-independent protein translocase subunit TatA/TatB n=1 Tax=Halosquirtibacter xylanolyticus TaxID=3374599 RepID=UPI003748DF25